MKKIQFSITTLIVLLIHTLPIFGEDNYYFPPLTGDEWETISPDELNWNSEKIDDLYSYLEKKNSKGFLLLYKGKIVMEKYYGDFGQDSLWYWASAAKTLTTFLAGIAREQGFISIDDPASDYLGSGWTICTQEQENAITIKHLLAMTSGLDDEVVDNHCTLPECLKYKAAPGMRWSYHNAPRTKLQDLLEEAVATTFSSYTRTQLSNKIGMSGFWYQVDYDHVYFSDLRSMARFGMMILNRGKWDGNVIMTDSLYFNDMVNTSQNLNKSYGYMWWLNGKGSYMLPETQYVFKTDLIPSAPDDLIAALGKNDQKIYISQSNDLVVVRMGDAAGNPFAGAESFNNEIWEMLADIIDLKSSVEDQPTDLIEIYPVPVTNRLNIHGTNGQFRIEIYNSRGFKIYSEILNSPISLEMTDFPVGMYYVIVSDLAGKISTQKNVMKI